MAVGEPFDRRRGGASDRVDDPRVGLAVVLAPDVGSEQLGGVRHPGRALESRARRRHEPGREGGGARRRGVPLEDEDLGAGVAGSERGDQSARAGADDEHRHAELERRAVVEDHRHR